VEGRVRSQFIPDPPAHCPDLIDIVIFAWNQQIDYLGVDFPALQI
jgi:hypothetical protein